MVTANTASPPKAENGEDDFEADDQKRRDAWQFAELLNRFGGVLKDKKLTIGPDINIDVPQVVQRRAVVSDGRIFPVGVKPIKGMGNKFKLNIIDENDYELDDEIEVKFINRPGHSEMDVFPMGESTNILATSRQAQLFLVTLSSHGQKCDAVCLRRRDGFAVIQTKIEVYDPSLLDQDNPMPYVLEESDTGNLIILKSECNVLVVDIRDEPKVLLFVGRDGYEFFRENSQVKEEKDEFGNSRLGHNQRFPSDSSSSSKPKANSSNQQYQHVNGRHVKDLSKKSIIEVLKFENYSSNRSEPVQVTRTPSKRKCKKQSSFGDKRQQIVGLI